MNPTQTHRIVLVQYRDEPVSLGQPTTARLQPRTPGVISSWKVDERRCRSVALPDFDRAADLEKLGGDLRPAQPVRLGLEQRNERRMLV